jgi:hypothetical protein
MMARRGASDGWVQTEEQLVSFSLSLTARLGGYSKARDVSECVTNLILYYRSRPNANIDLLFYAP